ncbi:S-layer homology domain-containing protein [Phormidesmis sp. 146-35]
MTSSPEPPPSRRRLEPDELIAILVAFGSIGAIFFWAIGQPDSGFDLSSLLSSPAPVASPVPSVAASPVEREGIQPSVVAPASPMPGVPTVDPPNQNFTIAPVPIPQTGSAVTPASPVPASPPPPRVTGFSDVPATYWANPYIAELTQRGILQGFPDGTFQPDKPVTRAEFAGIVSKAFERAKSEQPLAFQDLPADYWAKGAIDESIQTGFMNGYPGGIFRPDQPIPLSQLQVALVTGLNLKPKSDPVQVLSRYQDAQEVPKWAVSKVAAAVESGLVVDYPDGNKLTPDRGATRADAAALIYQALVTEGKVKKIQR